MTNILITYYSAYGHTFKMARSAAEELKESKDIKVKMTKIPEFIAARKAMSGQKAYEEARQDQKNIPEVTLDDLTWADGFLWGVPTRFGLMPAQMKQFLDTAGGLWAEGKLEGKPAAVFTSTNTIHGGQETTVLSTMIPFLHFGMILVGLPYGENQELMKDNFSGGSPYGASTVAGAAGDRSPTKDDLTMVKRLGKRVARIATALKND